MTRAFLLLALLLAACDGGGGGQAPGVYVGGNVGAYYGAESSRR